jgi:hypothetical protein
VLFFLLWHLQAARDIASARSPPAMTAPRDVGPPSAVTSQAPAGSADRALAKDSATASAYAPNIAGPAAAAGAGAFDAALGELGPTDSFPSTLNPTVSSSAFASSTAWPSQAVSSVGTVSTELASSSMGTGGRRTEALSAMLKARSDIAVLRDIKLGPLLGAGSFGRVYKGEAQGLWCRMLSGCANSRVPWA